VGLLRSAARYEPRPDQDEEVIAVLLELAERFPERGFAKLFKLIRRRGLRRNHKRVWRMYCKLKLNRRWHGKKRLPKRNALSLAVGEAINVCWCADFMADALWNGRRFRTFNHVQCG
jgi:putative transposase